MLATDGNAAFSVFIYEHLEVIDEIEEYQVGFDSGDDDEFLNIMGRSSESAQYAGHWQSISSFRIDGMTSQPAPPCSATYN